MPLHYINEHGDVDGVFGCERNVFKYPATSCVFATHRLNYVAEQGYESPEGSRHKFCYPASVSRCWSRVGAVVEPLDKCNVGVL